MGYSCWIRCNRPRRIIRGNKRGFRDTRASWPLGRNDWKWRFCTRKNWCVLVRLIGEEEEGSYSILIVRPLKAWIDRMRNRPIMSGGYLRPSAFNRPLPRFYRQPIHITMMMRRRIKAKIRRLEKQPRLREWLDDIRSEDAFQTSLWEQGGYEAEHEMERMVPYGKNPFSVLCFLFRFRKSN